MKTKKTLLISIICLSLTLTGCSWKKTDNSNSNANTSVTEPESVKENTVSDKPLEFKDYLLKDYSDWSVYTNPNYRYELRYPKDWKDVENSGKDDVGFMSKDSQPTENYKGDLRIIGHVNIKKLTVEEYFAQEGQDNFIARSPDTEDVGFQGMFARRYYNVEGIYPDRTVDILLIHGGDRILEIHLFDNMDMINTILSSMTLYQN